MKNPMPMWLYWGVIIVNLISAGGNIWSHVRLNKRIKAYTDAREELMSFKEINMKGLMPKPGERYEVPLIIEENGVRKFYM